ncbi:hypothetical protein GCM10025880_59570 [Methylorubrum aminovorans]|nr:hypothetical protein GCM10025880_59570 [Methylorubrum aminovorans]
MPRSRTTGIVPLRAAHAEAEQVAEFGDRQRHVLAALTCDLRDRAARNGGECRGIEPRERLRGSARQGETASAGGDDHHRAPCGRERQGEDQRSAVRLAAGELHLAVQGASDLRHHRQAHAAARQRIDRPGGGEAGLERQREQRLGLQALTRRDQSALAARRLDRREVRAPSVVVDAEHQPSALRLHGEHDREGGRFASPLPDLRALGAVAQRVAQGVQHRVLKRLEHRPVDRHVEPARGDVHLLAVGARHVAHRAGETAEHRLRGHQGEAFGLLA